MKRVKGDVGKIRDEYLNDMSEEFSNLLNLYLCIFQRLTSVEQLRKTLGAGTNALDFQQSIDTNTVTLIDLASPKIGTHGVRIMGTLLMARDTHCGGGGAIY